MKYGSQLASVLIWRNPDPSQIDDLAPQTTLTNGIPLPLGMAIDGVGNIYVMNGVANITVYEPLREHRPHDTPENRSVLDWRYQRFFANKGAEHLDSKKHSDC